MKAQLLEYWHFNTKLMVILFAGFLTALKHLFLEYVFDDLKFLIGIGLLMFTDTLSGSVAAMLKAEFSMPLLFKKIIRKCVSYALFIGGVSMLIKLKVGDQPASWVQWLDDYLYMGVAINEFASIIQNVDVINPGLFPPWIKKFIKDGAEKGSFTKPLVLVFIASWLLVGCVTNRQILTELRSYKTSQDSLISKNHLFYNYEKSRIDSLYRNIPDDELLNRIRIITGSKPKN